MTSIAALSAADRATFVAAIGFAFEHSPWIAEAAWQRRPFADLDDLLTALNDVVARDAPGEIGMRGDQRDPTRLGRLTAASLGEQAAAGLDRLTSDELARFEAANAAYRARFGFPFVICAREHDKRSILAELERRSHGERSDEIARALEEIAKIARLRLEDTITT